MPQTKKIIILLGILLVCSVAFGQNPSVYQNIVFNRTGQPLAGANVAVCLSNPGTSPVPCTNLATTFSDITVSTQCTATGSITYGPNCSNPGITDGFGNYIIYADAGQVLWAQISGPRITTYVVPFIMPGTSSGGGGAVGPGSVGHLPIFTSTTSIGDSFCNQRLAATGSGILGTVGCAFGFSVQGSALMATKNRAGPIGTRANFLAAINSSGNALDAQPTDTNNVVGISTGTGTAGSVDIAYSGQYACQFDNQTSYQDWVTLGSDSQCHDAGSTEPAGIENIGRVGSVNAGAGTLATVNLGFPDATNTSSGGGTGVVGNCSTAGAAVYQQLTGNTTNCDAATNADGAGNWTFNSLKTVGSGSGLVDITSPTSTPADSDLSLSIGTDGRGNIEFDNSLTTLSNLFFDVDGGIVLNPDPAAANAVTINNAPLLMSGNRAGGNCFPSKFSLYAGFPIRIGGDTSGDIELKAADIAGSNCITLPPATGTLALTSQVLGLNNVLLYAAGTAINDGSAHIVSGAPSGSVFNGKTTLAGIAAISINGTTPFSWITAAPFTGSGAYGLTNSDVPNLDIAWLAIQAALMTGKTYIPGGTNIVGSVKALPLYIPLAVETNTTVSASKIMIQGDGARVSIIKAGTDFGSGVPLIACGDPAGTFGNSLGRYSGGSGQCSGDMQDVGFFSSTGNLTPTIGATPINMDGIAWGARLRTKDVEASGFNHDWTLVGDHTQFIRPRAFGGTIGFEWAAPNSVLQGDLTFDDFMVSGQSIASISVASNATMSGTAFNGETYLSAPIAIRGEGGGCSDLMNGATFDTMFDEFIGNAFISDESGLSAGVWTNSSKCRNIIKAFILGQWFQNWDNSKLWTTGGRGRRATIDAAQINLIIGNMSGGGAAQMAPITPGAGPTPLATFNVNKFVVDTQAGTSISGDIYGWNTQNSGTGLGIPLWVAADSSKPYMNAIGQSQGQELVLGLQGVAGGPTTLSMYGNTSGKASIAGPNVAGTITNPFVSTNYFTAPGLTATSKLTMPTGAAFATTANGEIGYDTTKNWPHVWAMSGSAGGPTDKAMLLQSTTELDASSYAQGSSTCGIQEAIAALPNAAATGGTVHIHGRCGYSTTITIKANSGQPDRVTLAGDGANATSLVYSGAGDAITVGGTTYDTRFVTIRDLNISTANAAANGVHHIRTKHFVLYRVSGDAGGGSNDFVLNDGSTTGGSFSSFGYFGFNQCNNGWAKCFDQEGSGSNEASTNNNTYEGNETTALTPGTGYGYYFHTGGSNRITGGDCDGFLVCTYVASRFNIIDGNMEGNTTDLVFDNSVWSAAQYNTLIGSCAGGCTFTDNGLANIKLDPKATLLNNLGLSHLLMSVTAPSISSGFGTSPSVTANNGSATFRVNVGTGASATSGVIAMNTTATTGWNCSVNDLTAAAAHVAYNTRQTASSATTVTVENQTTSTGAAIAWAASDILTLQCAAF